MSQRVFISYSQPDYDVASGIARELEAAGLETWLAPRKLSGGDRLSSIHQHIESSDVFVAVLSKASLKSNWVKHEINTALALSLDGKAIRVVPVSIDGTRRPIELADILAVDLRPNKYATGLRSLVDIIKGDAQPSVSVEVGFVGYLESLVLLDHDVCWAFSSHFLDCRVEAFVRGETEESFCAKIRTHERLGIRGRTKDLIAEKLAETGIKENDRDRILTAYDDFAPFPAISPEDKEKIRDWVRVAGEGILNLAADLYRLALMGKHGVTLRWFYQRCARGDDSASSREVEWRAQQLVDQAKDVGLLAPTTEYLSKGTYAARDAEINPAHDLGPMVRLVGRHFLYYRDSVA